MITIKSDREIEKMRVAGRMVGRAHEEVAKVVRPGVTTRDLEEIAERTILEMGGKMAFFGYRGFPGKICVSVNEEVVHGIPGDRVLREGDIVGVDIGAIYQSYYGDGARTHPVGEVSPEMARLVGVCRDALEAAIRKVCPGSRISDLSRCIQDHVAAEPLNGRPLGLVEQYVGHGIGRQLHEEPQVPNYVPENGGGPDHVLEPGMTLAIEPMVNAGTKDVRTLPDGWTVVTRDGKWSAHFEHTVLVTKDGHEILTLP